MTEVGAVTNFQEFSFIISFVKLKFINDFLLACKWLLASGLHLGCGKVGVLATPCQDIATPFNFRQ